MGALQRGLQRIAILAAGLVLRASPVWRSRASPEWSGRSARQAGWQSGLSQKKPPCPVSSRGGSVTAALRIPREFAQCAHPGCPENPGSGKPEEREAAPVRSHQDSGFLLLSAMSIWRVANSISRKRQAISAGRDNALLPEYPAGYPEGPARRPRRAQTPVAADAAPPATAPVQPSLNQNRVQGRMINTRPNSMQNSTYTTTKTRCSQTGISAALFRRRFGRRGRWRGLRDSWR